VLLAPPMTIEIRQHTPGDDIDDFIQAGRVVFRDDPAWVAPLNMDIRDRLTPAKNPFFQHGEVALFTAWRGGRLVGRCSTSIDQEHLALHQDDTGFFGFFDTVDDDEVGAVLLDHARAWLRRRGMKHMRGPISLNMNEEVGILVEGHEHPPAVMMDLSEDEGDGGFYRFRPAGMNAAGFPDLTAGALEIAEVAADGAVTWHEVPDPSNTSGTSVRNQVAAATRFDGGEGIWYHDGVVYLSTKGDTRVWAYDVVAQSIAVLYDGEAIMDPPLTGVDNVVVSCCGDVLVAEDGGSMQIVAILPSGELKPLVQVTGQDDSEITGPAFDPSGTRLYFNSQRGTTGSGFTYEITGPFHEPA